MKHRIYKVLSAVFFGVFLAPFVTILCFVVPWLRNFPVGDDSPHGIGLPLGFLIGVVVGRLLDRRFRWGRAATIGGSVFLAVSILSSFVTLRLMMDTPGWEGLKWLAGLLLSMHVVVSALGLLLAGLFSRLGHRGRGSMPEEVSA